MAECNKSVFGIGIYAQTPLPSSFVPKFQKIRQLPTHNVAKDCDLVYVATELYSNIKKITLLCSVIKLKFDRYF